VLTLSTPTWSTYSPTYKTEPGPAWV